MQLNVTWVKCEQEKNLTVKNTKSRGVVYEHYYLQHYIRESKKIAWCYIGSYSKLPEEYKDKIKEIKTIHNSQRTIHDNERLLI